MKSQFRFGLVSLVWLQKVRGAVRDIGVCLVRRGAEMDFGGVVQLWLALDGLDWVGLGWVGLGSVGLGWVGGCS